MKKQLMLMMSLITLLAGCRSYPVPEGAVAVKPFDKINTWVPGMK